MGCRENQKGLPVARPAGGRGGQAVYDWGTNPMYFLLTPVGSSGDVHPYVGIGTALRARGHQVTLLAAEPHRPVAERAGLEFGALNSAEEYHAATLDPDLWHPRRGLAKVMTLVASGLEAGWRQLEAHYRPGHTILVGHPLAFVTRCFEEKTGAPAATLHLAPSSLRTAYRVPAFPPHVDISGWPLPLKQAFWAVVDRLSIDPLIVPALNRFRAERGLAPVRRVFKEWINSPNRTIGLFPEWFGPRQPDWPHRFAYASFPLWDDPGSASMDVELERFLAAGSPPVVVTPGSANRHAESFFAAAATALGRLGRRGLFLTGFPEQLPPKLPAAILHRPYAPFSAVLPGSAALIHHGGIGTLAQGMAAGVPQLIMPMGFDQPDNALRARALGIARWVLPGRFTADRVTRSLGELLNNSVTAGAVGECRERLRQRDGIGLVCDLLEELGTQ